MTGGDLTRYLCGSPDSFTGYLLALMDRADAGNLATLELAFPKVAAARRAWLGTVEPPTFRELTRILISQRESDENDHATADGA